MMGIVHALTGAGLGALFGKKTAAFMAGFTSHALGDVFPHKESSVTAELVLMGAALGGLAARYGKDSPEFFGAIGAVSPDAEHALVEMKLLPESDRKYPTHNGRLPHNSHHSYTGQIIAGAACILIAEYFWRRKKRKSG